MNPGCYGCVKGMHPLASSMRTQTPGVVASSSAPCTEHVFHGENEKAEIAFTYFDAILGTPPMTSAAINLNALGIPKINVAHLEKRFFEAEVWEVIKSLPLDKAPGPYDFIARFLQGAWEVIRPDIMRAFQAFWELDMRQDVNEALLALLPKNPEADEIKDYRPISLIHCIGKLIAKVLAKRLAPKLNKVVNQSQSVFIKGRYIQDNFKFVQATTKLLHVRKKLSLLIKLDIAKAFDSVAWPFLLNILKYLCFGQVWHDWLSALLSTSSTHTPFFDFMILPFCNFK
jgi:hypothetical protein